MTRMFSIIAEATGWRRVLICLIAGLCLSLGQAPLSLPWGIFPGLGLAALLIRDAGRGRAAFTLWLIGTTYFATSLTWIVEPFLVDIERHGWLAPFGLIFMAGGLALFWAVAGGLAALARGLAARPILLAAALTLAEFARANVLTGFPWGLLAYHWIDTPVALSLAITGPHGLGLISALLGVAVVLRFPWGLGVSALATLVLWFGFAATLPDENQPDETQPADPFIVRLIQPNAAQHLKWKSENLQLFFDRQISLSASQGPRDVVIWPETSVPFLLGEHPDLEVVMSDAAAAPVVFGARRVDQNDDGSRIWYNTMGVLDRGATLQASYDKHHLVPFGEYMPFSATLNKLGLYGLAQFIGGFGSGSGPQVINAAGLPPFLALICYEAIFPHEMQATGPRPRWLLHITNDAWFGTNSGPYQHLAQARARAIEQGLPLARAANTGISAMIDPWGRITASLPLGEAGYLDAPLPQARDKTIYAKSGDWPTVLAVIFLAISAGVLRVRQKY